MLELCLGRPGDAALQVLCLGAHSDDIEIGCGGTIGRILREHPGTKVDWVVFSATPDRAREARASAAAFLAGAAETNVVIKDFRESFFPYVATAIKEAFEELKSFRPPDVIFSHRRADLHQDHRLLAELTWNTYRDHLILEYEIAKYEGDLGHPNVFVPLSRAEADRKVECLLTHFPSQRGHSWFNPDTFQGLMSLRGAECNAAESRAEAFHGRKLRL
jgi:LmbE family N-acetylglucosaminyl deacetylase